MQWWIRRIEYCFKLLYDIVRIDHFRGFDEYYSIPYGDDRLPEFGALGKGPGYRIYFNALKEALGKVSPLLRRILGFLTPIGSSAGKRYRLSGYEGAAVCIWFQWQ